MTKHYKKSQLCNFNNCYTHTTNQYCKKHFELKQFQAQLNNKTREEQIKKYGYSTLQKIKIENSTKSKNLNNKCDCLDFVNKLDNINKELKNFSIVSYANFKTEKEKLKGSFYKHFSNKSKNFLLQNVKSKIYEERREFFKIKRAELNKCKSKDTCEKCLKKYTSFLKSVDNRIAKTRM